MPYRTMGWIHANLARMSREQSGQGTVEYVGLMLLLAGAADRRRRSPPQGMRDGGGLAKEIANKLKETIESIGAAGARARPRLRTDGGRGGRLCEHGARALRPAAHRSDRRLRLRRRRPDGPARAARRAAAGGLPVPRRLRALSLRRPHARGAARVQPADRRRAARARREAHRRRLQLGDVERAGRRSPRTSRERGCGVDVIGVVGPESNLAVAQHAQRAHRRARDAGDGRQRRLRARGARRRPARAADERRLPAARADLAGRRADHRGRRRRSPASTARRCATAQVDTAILGCTHYPFVGSLLQRLLGPQVTLITSGTAIARRVQHALDARDLATPHTGEGRYSFLCTGDAAAFAEVGSRFLQLPMGTVDHVELPIEVPA